MKPKKNNEYVHLTYPYDRPGPKTDDPKLKIEHIKKQFNYATPSIKGLDPIPWKDIRAITIESGGSSNGAILVQTVEGALAVKGSPSPALEYFANLVLKDLRIRTPNMRLLQYTDDEFKTAVDCIQKASYADPTQKYKIRQVIDRPFLLVTEYVPFRKIHQLGEKRAKLCFEPAYPEGRDRLIRLGILYAADTLLNIRDRYPLIWGNPGNTENLLVGFETNWINRNEELFDENNLNLQMTALCPIDNKPFLISKKTHMSQEAYDLYLQEFERVVKYAFEGLKPVRDGIVNPFDSSTKRFDYASLSSTFIYNHTSIDVKSLGEMQILLGLLIGYVNIYNLGFGRIERSKMMTHEVLRTDWKNIWKDDYENIRLDIIKQELKIIKKYMDHNEDVISWVNTITLHNYFIKYDKFKEGDEFNESIELPDTKSATEDNDQFKDPDQYDEWLEGKLYQHFGIADPNMSQNNRYNNPMEQTRTVPDNLRQSSNALKQGVQTAIDDARLSKQDTKGGKKQSRNASPARDGENYNASSPLTPKPNSPTKDKKGSNKGSPNGSPVNNPQYDPQSPYQQQQQYQQQQPQEEATPPPQVQQKPPEKKKKKGWFG